MRILSQKTEHEETPLDHNNTEENMPWSILLTPIPHVWNMWITNDI